MVIKKKSQSLYWPESSTVLHGKKRFVERLAKTGALSEWIKQYKQHINKVEKTEREIRADLDDRAQKLTQLLSEDLLNREENKIVKKELEEIRDLLAK